MSEITLPPVAKSIFLECKKCEAERYFTVLAHTSSTSAKLQCEVCKCKKTYKLPKAQERKTVKKTSTRKSPKKDDIRVEYQSLLANHKDDIIKYSIKEKFKEGQPIDHKSFGIGFVKEVRGDRIDVLFEEEIKTLIHDKG